MVDTPRMSSNLTFSASYQSDNGGNSINQSVDCPLSGDCTVDFAVNVLSNDTIRSVIVTVSGPYGDNSSMTTTNLREFFELL